MKKDKSFIPKGFYCYTRLKNGGIIKCPYWSLAKDKPHQENGYCSYLQKGDWDINKETEWEDKRTGEIKTARQIGLPMSLLWDMCKECGINEYTDEEIEKLFEDS